MNHIHMAYMGVDIDVSAGVVIVYMGASVWLTVVVAVAMGKIIDVGAHINVYHGSVHMVRG